MLVSPWVPFLTLKQTALVFSRGSKPSYKLMNRIDHLRQLGVPFDVLERGRGRGTPLLHSYLHLVELGIALYARDRVDKIKAVSSLLIQHRERLRPIYGQVLYEIEYESRGQKNGAKGASQAIDRYLLFPRHYTMRWEAIKFVGMGHSGVQVSASLGELSSRLCIPLNQLAREWVAQVASNLEDELELLRRVTHQCRKTQARDI